MILDLIDYDVEDEYEQDDEEGTITIYGDPKSYAAIQKHLEECGFEDVGGDFTYIPNDLKDVTPEQRETLDKMIERLEEFDDVQTVYTNSHGTVDTNVRKFYSFWKNTASAAAFTAICTGEVTPLPWKDCGTVWISGWSRRIIPVSGLTRSFRSAIIQNFFHKSVDISLFF